MSALSGIWLRTKSLVERTVACSVGIMGRGYKPNRGRGGGRGRGRGRGRQGGGRDEWNTNIVERKNEKFERYYNELGIVPEEEREQFWSTARSDLPNSFRFTGSRGHALTVQRTLVDRYIPQLTSVEYEGKPVTPPEPIPWYPDKLAWSMTTPKNVIRKFPPFASFQKFLVSENSVGNITRQEIVSMIPPLMLDIKSGMTVLDMCAAPGSKSTQLVELLHNGEEARVRRVMEGVRKEQGRESSPEGIETKAEKELDAAGEDWSDDGRATGLLIANDSDWRRAQMLVHQCKRLNSPNLIVTNHDATLFPSIKLPSEPGRQNYLKFDRILADVPCSGDGTARKNYNVWKDWRPGNGIGLHALQTRILVRALQMLQVGGKVVYSTCSMNPLENEAVVAAAIDRCGGTSKVTLVDRSDFLPAMKRRPGLSSWKVMDKSSKTWPSWQELEDARGAEGAEDVADGIQETMFPPNEDMNLERCVRIYPHLQDTGGFFVAVLEKHTEIKAKPETNIKAKHLPPPKKPTIMSVVDEIEERTVTGADDSGKLETLDKIMPDNAPRETEEGSVPAIARQAEAEDQNGVSPTGKRPAADTNPEEDTSNKRAKIDEGTIPQQKEHQPPPPAADLGPAHPSTNGQSTPTTATTAPPRNPTEESFKYLSPTHPVLEEIYGFYGLPDRFPRDRYLVRNHTGDPAKAIYYTSDFAKAILTENEGKGIKFVHSGVKMFVKQDAQGADTCPWRIQSEGLPIIEAWVSERRVVRLNRRRALHTLLKELFPRLLDDDGNPRLADLWDQVRNIGPGCCVLKIEPMTETERNNKEDGFDERMALPIWRGVKSLNLMLPKEDRKAMMLRLFNDESGLIDFSKEKRAKQAQEAARAQPKPQQNVIERNSSSEPENDNDDEQRSEAEQTNQEEERRKNIDALGMAAQLDEDRDVAMGEVEAAKDSSEIKEREPGEFGTAEQDEFNKTV